MRRFVLLLIVTLVAVVFPHRNAHCGNINITTITVGTLSGGSATINFDVTWANSWRFTAGGAPAPNNWDAAWVFVKYRTTTGGTIGEWKHASLDNTGHSVGTGTAATYSVGYPDTSSSFNIATNPGVGVFLYRSGDGAGTFSLTGASLSWNYSQDGVTGSDTVDVRVFGIEMVHIPTGAFFAGDNATSDASFRQGSADNDPWYIGGDAAITTSNAAGTGTGQAETAAEYYYKKYGAAGEAADGAVFTIPAAFPNGYKAFYMMKGEISQRQWVAFFNTLNSNQTSTRDIVATKGNSLNNRNNVRWTSGDATLPDQGSGATYETVAMNYLSWADLTAYLDWAGLRPMSELEYERAGRGPYRAVSGEYAWGSTSITQATSISNGGKSNEAPGAAANCVYGSAANVQGAMRVGSMAYGDATRIASGAGYYGSMDLSGNVDERAVTVGNSTGLAFEGRYHGNGVLTDVSGNYGNADVSTWPGTNATGSGLRGGNWNDDTSYARLSARIDAALGRSMRTSRFGGRGVRFAP